MKKWTAPFYVISREKIIICFLLIVLAVYFGDKTGSIYSDDPMLRYAPFLFLFSIYFPILKMKDRDARNLQLLFYKKKEADYLLFENRLQIVLKEKNSESKNIDLVFNDNFYFLDKVSEMHRFFSSPDFSLIYLTIKKGSLKKNIAIFIPKDEIDNVKESLLNYNKLFTGANAEKKNEPKLLKVTFIIVMIIVALFGIIIAWQGFMNIFE